MHHTTLLRKVPVVPEAGEVANDEIRDYSVVKYSSLLIGFYLFCWVSAVCPVRLCFVFSPRCAGAIHRVASALGGILHIP